MIVALCQINPTIGDFSGNLDKLSSQVDMAKQRGADLVLFPELASTGYPPRDLLEHPDFVDKNLQLIDTLAKQADGIAILVGFVQRNEKAQGRALHNAAVLLKDKRRQVVAVKSLLPTYDVFDERRYFEPATETTVVEVGGKRIGVTICEDLWSDPEILGPKGLGVTSYARDPAAELQSQKVDFLVNLSASPFYVDKAKLRHQLFSRVASRTGLPVLFVNQVGANDDLIFDGASFVVDAKGNLTHSAAAFAEEMLLWDSDKPANPLPEVDAVDVAKQLSDALILGIGDYFRKCGFRQAVVGLSGGVDSALVTALAAEALGKDNVQAIMMPSRFTSEMSLKSAKQLAENLGIAYEQISIEPIFTAYLEQLQPIFATRAWDSTEENLQARIRGALLMAYANKFGHLLLSTGNKSELAVGYCTLYGDLGGGLAVISDVLKTQVYAICHYLNRHSERIPAEILTRPPSAELRQDQRDQDSLPDYETLDRILQLYVEDHQSEAEIVAQGLAAATVAKVLRMVDLSEYKRRQAPLGLKVSRRAFGGGRRQPIAQRYR